MSKTSDSSNSERPLVAAEMGLKARVVRVVFDGAPFPRIVIRFEDLAQEIEITDDASGWQVGQELEVTFKSVT